MADENIPKEKQEEKNHGLNLFVSYSYRNLHISLKKIFFYIDMINIQYVSVCLF